MVTLVAQELADKASSPAVQDNGRGADRELVAVAVKAPAEASDDRWEKRFKDAAIGHYKLLTAYFDGLDVGGASDPTTAQSDSMHLLKDLASTRDEARELKEQVAELTAKLEAQDAAHEEQRRRETAELKNRIAVLESELMPSAYYRDKIKELTLLSERHKVHIRSLQNLVIRERGY
ncbi:hypothetical protein H4R19_001115 [Coemansia spiralis]|nr:hypothetical protein H4R19_001115 [Coemansia spiralis]